MTSAAAYPWLAGAGSVGTRPARPLQGTVAGSAGVATGLQRVRNPVRPLRGWWWSVAWALATTAAIACASAVLANDLKTGNARSLAAADRAFLAIRDASLAADTAGLAQQAQLGDHPLAAYVEYWRLTARLRAADPAVVAAVEDFFSRHAGTYIADRLRLDWALALASRGDFSGFQAEADRLVWHTDDAQLRCFAALARFRTASNSELDAAADEGRRLLARTREPAGEGCVALGEALLDDGRLSALERARVLVEQNQWSAAKTAATRSREPKGRAVEQNVLAQAVDRPSAFLRAHERRLARVPRDLAVIAVVRLARDDPREAAEYASALDSHMTPELRAIVWGRIGHMAALRGMPEANAWYRRGGELVGVGADTARADEVLEWQVRAALRAGDWPGVKRTIERMPSGLRSDPAWIYWYGRALQTDDRSSEAQEQFARIASQFHFYGILAAEELGRPLVVPPRAAAVTPEEIAPMAANAGFARARKFYELGLRAEGNREWNWQLRGMSDRQLLAVAEHARSLSLLDRMINTSDRTRSEFDFTQRFPAPFAETMERYARPLALDPAWVYGLIRQESRFIIDLRSRVGAAGLMQLMPGTASYVARKMNMADFSWTRVDERDVNLQLGTGYLKLVLDDLDGHPVLATAAYNAGPRRAREWRSTLARPLEGALFAETIPFDETRDYVKKVMSNTVVYAALFGGTGPSLKARLGTVAPKAAGTTGLP